MKRLRCKVFRSICSTAFVAAVLVTGCAHNDSAGVQNERLAVGTWGGDNAGVIVDDTVAHVHIGCTFGNFPAPVILDTSQRFAIDGSYVLRAYPIQVGPALPAQLAGVVSGRTLTLTVAVNDTVEKKIVALGPVTVRLGDEPKLGPCPICRKPSAIH